MTPRQKELLDAIRALTVDGVSPTYDELRLHVGLSSKGEVHRMVVALERLGYVRRLKGRRRTIEIVDRAPRFLSLDAMSTAELTDLSSQVDAVIRSRAVGAAA